MDRFASAGASFAWVPAFGSASGVAVGAAGAVDASSGGSCVVGHPWAPAWAGIGAGVAFAAASVAAWAESVASGAT